MKPVSCRGKTLQYLKIAVLLFLLVTSLYGSYRMKIYMQSQEVKYRLVYEYLKGIPTKNIYCMNVKWPLRLNYYFKYQIGDNNQNPFSGFSTLPEGENKQDIFRDVFKIKDYRQITDAYVIVDKTEFFFWDPEGNKVGRRDNIPEFIYQPPGEWELLHKTEKVSVYLAPLRY